MEPVTVKGRGLVLRPEKADQDLYISNLKTE